jgi:predicted dienelactone hydrolase
MRIKSITRLVYSFIIILILCACNQASETPSATQTSQPTQEVKLLPLAEPGPFHVGQHILVATDPSRANRQVSISVWYPTAEDTGSSSVPARDADPDSSDAPYPLILSSTKVANIFAPYLVSHGFTWASVDGIDSYMSMNEQMIDQPLDILFALDQVASHPPEGLEGVIDSENAGAIGYSFDGYNALAMSGARIDPKYYLAQCPTPDAMTEAILGGMSSFSCVPAGEWDQFVAHIDSSITESDDGLWQPLTDKRIRAVMPMAAEGWWLFGEKGLAAVDRPVLIIDSTEDELYKENALIYEHLGTSDKSFISFIGPDHMMIYDEEMIARMGHFAVAFFGYHLQNRDEYAKYFSEDFVSQQTGLAWGVYSGK